MHSRSSLAADFGLKVLLPSLSAALGIAVLLFYVINGLLDEMGSIDRHYARRAAGAFLANLEDEITRAATEKYSDTAQGKVLKENWGAAPASGDHESAFLLDANLATIVGFIDGLKVEKRAEDVTGPSARPFLTAFAMTAKPGDVRPAIIARDGEFRAVAITAVAAPALPAARYLLVERTLDNGYVTRQGLRFNLYNARIAPGMPKSENGLPVFSYSGSVIGHVAWQPENLAMSAPGKYNQVVWAILASLFFVIGMLVRMSWKSFRSANAVRAEAIESSLRDDLTGLPNRRQLIELLDGYLAEPPAPGRGVSVIYADLDGFKEVNDAYGHEIGDLLLKSAAGGFEYLVAGKGIVSRLGGDEFAVLLQGADSASVAREIAANMQRFLAEPIVFGGRVASVSVSAGIVDRSESDADVTADELLRRADAAMYVAKGNGRNRIHVYDPSLDSKREENRSIARELRAAIDSSSLGVVYQPIVDARTRCIAGVEALVRWPKTATRRLTPDVFVPVAEEFGMIEDLGYFVMLQACRQAVQWPGISLSVNVSPLQFVNPTFADTVARILAITGLDPTRLELEVTEGFIIDNAERAAAIIDNLHKLRVSVSLDDFGTGYSSIGHLRRFKFDKLKLDRSMVIDILRQPSALRLVQGTIAMADALGMRVTAEGIEDENQVSVLRLAGCSLFQGFLFSKPVEAAQITAMLESYERRLAV